MIFIPGLPSIANVTGSKGDGLISLECIAAGQPTPTITYLSETGGSVSDLPGHHVQGNILSIDIEHVQTQYTCMAENMYGTDRKIISGKQK